MLLLLSKSPGHRCTVVDTKMAPTRESLTLVHAKNKGADLYSYTRSLISGFIVGVFESIIYKLASCKISF